MTTPTSYLKYIPSMASPPSGPPPYLSTSVMDAHHLRRQPGPSSKTPDKVLPCVELWLPLFGPGSAVQDLTKQVVPWKSFMCWRCFPLIKIIITGTINVEFTVAGRSAEHVTCLISFTSHNGPTRYGWLLSVFGRWGVLSLRRDEELCVRLLSQ